MSTLPVAVHTAAQVRALDRLAIDDLQIPSYTLMTRAGEAALGALRSCWPSAQRIAIVCGPGNNGGDGYVLARLAREQRLEVVAIGLNEPARLQGDAQRAHDDFLGAGGSVVGWDPNCLRGADVVVDALFGVGLSRPIAGVAAEAIAAINECDAHVLALDIPSGLHADTGEILGAAVRPSEPSRSSGSSSGSISARDRTALASSCSRGSSCRRTRWRMPTPRPLSSTRALLQRYYRGVGAQLTRVSRAVCS